MVLYLPTRNFGIILILHWVNIATSTDLHQFDYIIVGSGAGGSVLANRLSKHPLIQVLLLEAGERPPLISEVPSSSLDTIETPYNWNYTSVPNLNSAYGLKDQRFKIHAGKALGGTTSLNQYVRGNKKDYDEWAANGAYGWDWDNVLPYFLKDEDNKNFGIVANGYHGVGGDVVVQFPSFYTPIRSAYLEAAKSLGYQTGDFNGPHQTKFMPPQGTIKDGRRWSSLQAFINPVVGRRNLKIVTSAFVTKILINEHRQAYGVVYNYEGEVRSAYAKKEVILSAGTFNSPKLLMLSGIGPEQQLKKLQIPVVSDLPVGKNLQEHVSTPLLAFLADTFTLREDRIKKEDYAEFLTNGTGVLTTLGSIETIGFISSKYNEDPERPDLEIAFFTSSIASYKGTRIETNINDEVWSYFQPFQHKDTIMCAPYPTRPKSRGFVTLKSSDPHDDPIIDFDFYSHSQDLKVITEGLKFCLEISKTEPMRRFGVEPLPTTVPGCEKYQKFSEEYLGCMALVQPFLLSHYAGTCKMGDANDPSTVVDASLRVKGVKGLRVVDASVIPSLPACHTHSVVTMIAEKAAHLILHDAVKAKFSGYP